MDGALNHLSPAHDDLADHMLSHDVYAYASSS